MRRRDLPLTLLLLGLLAALAAMWPRAAFACTLADPGCYIDDFVHKQLYQLNLSIWQLNRGALAAARWLEDLRTWVIEGVLVNIFTALTRPIAQFFVLALILAWMLFVISHMIQALVAWRLVDIKRAIRPIALAWLIFQYGGQVILWGEQVRLTGNALVQETAGTATAALGAPAVPMSGTGDLPATNKSIYTNRTSCGTAARTVPLMQMNDFAARYLWSNAEDIHCAPFDQLAGEFREHYFPVPDISGLSSGGDRQVAVGWAAQGAIRQITGLFMTASANLEQIVQLLFGVALALVWFGVLLSLSFAVFLPTEGLLIGQLRSFWTVLSKSWIAELLIGVCLTLLMLVAAAGSGVLMLFTGLLLIALCVWQCREALAVIRTAGASVSAAVGGTPTAFMSMVRGWGATGARLAADGALITGNLMLGRDSIREMLGQMGSTMLRRVGRNLGHSALGQAAGRVLTNRVAEKLEAAQATVRDESAAEQQEYRSDWYARLAAKSGDAQAREWAASARAEAAGRRTKVGAREAERLERRAWMAAQRGNTKQADALMREAAEIRKRTGAAPGDSAAVPDADLDRAVEQLLDAEDDPEMQRRILAQTAARAQKRAQLQAMRNRALREKRFEDAKGAIRELRALDAADAPTQPGTAAAATQPGAPAAGRGAQSGGGPGQPDGAAKAPAELPPLPAGHQQLTVTRVGGGAVINGRRLVKIQNFGDLRELHLDDGSVVTLTADVYRDMLHVGHRAQDGASFTVSGLVSPAPAGRTQAAMPSGGTGGAPPSARLRKLRASRQRIEGSGQGASMPVNGASRGPAAATAPAAAASGIVDVSAPSQQPVTGPEAPTVAAGQAAIVQPATPASAIAAPASPTSAPPAEPGAREAASTSVATSPAASTSASAPPAGGVAPPTTATAATSPAASTSVSELPSGPGAPPPASTPVAAPAATSAPVSAPPADTSAAPPSAVSAPPPGPGTREVASAPANEPPVRPGAPSASTPASAPPPTQRPPAAPARAMSVPAVKETAGAAASNGALSSTPATPAAATPSRGTPGSSPATPARQPWKRDKQ